MKVPIIGPYLTYYFDIGITECGMQYFSPASIQGHLPRTSLFPVAVQYVMWEMLVFLVTDLQASNYSPWVEDFSPNEFASAAVAGEYLFSCCEFPDFNKFGRKKKALPSWRIKKWFQVVK